MGESAADDPDPLELLESRSLRSSIIYACAQATSW